ncbi:MAG: diguanylate cyclase [Pseudomonadota bacterium]
MTDNHDPSFNEFHWMSFLLQNINVGIVVLNKNYKIQVWNAFMENHSGIQPQHARDKNLFDLFPQIPEKWFKRKCEAVFQLKNQSFGTWQQRPYLFEFDNYRPITSVENKMYQNFTIFPITSLAGETDNIALVIYDVTDMAISKNKLKHTNELLTKQSRIDALTQLYNRGYWELRIKQEFDRFKRYKNGSSIIMLDIDHFKKVNDTHGHLAGDEAIRFLASNIAKLKRSSDIAGRYGGEEFSILLTDTKIEDAFIFADRLRKKVEAGHAIYEKLKIEITISLGIAEFNSKVEDYKKIISYADEALYMSKQNGRNKVTIYQQAQLKQA